MIQAETVTVITLPDLCGGLTLEITPAIPETTKQRIADRLMSEVVRTELESICDEAN